LANHQQESLTVYTDGFRTYEPLSEYVEFTREYVVHGNGEYADGDVHVNICESTKESPKTNSRRISERFSFVVKSIENQGKRL